MTIMEPPVRSVGPFDPLEKFEGAWNIRLANRYWDLLNDLFAKWESIHGRLIVAPYEAAENSWGESTLIHLLRGAAPADQYYVFGCLNLALDPETWIQPGLNVLHRLPESAAWRRFVPVTYATMPIEFVSPASALRDKEEKPLLLAAAGVPYYMTVQLDQDRRMVRVEQCKLVGDVYKMIASASAGETFVMTEPFALNFPAEQLLIPEPPR